MLCSFVKQKCVNSAEFDSVDSSSYIDKKQIMYRLVMVIHK